MVIEHNLDVIKTADWIVDMGPEGGINGGKIIAEGNPEQVSEINASFTGNFIKNIIESSLFFNLAFILLLCLGGDLCSVSYVSILGVSQFGV